MQSDNVPTVAAFWRRLTAWLFPALALVACIVFFVSMAAKAGWIAGSAGGSAVSSGTVVAFGILLLILLAIVMYAWLAERVDRETSARHARDR
jgi:uncharacterized membrane protein (DUF485 family)